MKRVAVFMAGGRGERFWPLSTPSHPKHLLKIFNDKSLMQLSLKRVAGVVDEVRVVTSRPQEALMRKTLRALPAQKILAEPQGRDTAAAVALAACWVGKEGGEDTLIAMLPADHYIQNTRGFKKTLETAFALAHQTQDLVTIGIPPTRPATGYGYLEKADASGAAFRVARFKEKPDEATAQEYVRSGKYLWNAGIFVWSVRAISKAFRTHAPEIWRAVQSLDPANAAQMEALYPALPKISVDYAVMEKADNVWTVPAVFDWDDMGEWTAWARSKETDAAGNTTEGAAVLHNAQGNIVFNAEKKHLLAVLGGEDLMVIHTKDATLVAPKERAQELKTLLKKLGGDQKV